MTGQPGRVLVDSVSASVAVDRPKSTIRRWAHDGLITRQGKDAGGRTLYDLAEIYRVAQRLPKPRKRKAPE